MRFIVRVCVSASVGNNRVMSGLAGAHRKRQVFRDSAGRLEFDVYPPEIRFSTAAKDAMVLAV